MSIVTVPITAPNSTGYSATTDISSIEDMQMVEVYANGSGVFAIEFSNDPSSPANWFEAIRETASGQTAVFGGKIQGQVFTFGVGINGATKGTVDMTRARWARIHTVSGGTNPPTYTFFGAPSPGFATDVTLSAPHSISATSATDISALEDIIIQDAYSSYTGTVNIEFSVDGTNWHVVEILTGTGANGSFMYKPKGQTYQPTSGLVTVDVTRCNWVRLNSTAYTSGSADFRFTGKVRA
jgi:hypothetical protein